MATHADARPTDNAALATIVGHHRTLCRELDERFRALRIVTRVRAPYETPADRLLSFLEREVLPHAAAEEATLYRAAETVPASALLVRALKAEHASLTEHVRRLQQSRSAEEALAAAAGAAALFESHVAKENDLLLPALAGDPDTSLAELHEAMERRLAELTAHEPEGMLASGC